MSFVRLSEASAKDGNAEWRDSDRFNDDKRKGADRASDSLLRLHNVLMSSHDDVVRCLEPCMETVHRLEAENSSLRAQLARTAVDPCQDTGAREQRRPSEPGNGVPHPFAVVESVPEGEGFCMGKVVGETESAVPAVPHDVWTLRRTVESPPVWMRPPTPLKPSPPTTSEPVVERKDSDWSAELHELQEITRPPQRKSTRRRTLFMDAIEMKEKVKMQLLQQEYHVSKYYRTTGWCQRVARKPAFDTVTLFVIAVNCIWLAVDADHNHAAIITQAPPIFQVAEHMFCLFFLVEWGIRFMSFKNKRDCVKDWWLIFDGALLATMVIETYLIPVMFALSSIAVTTSITSSFVAIRVLKALRLLRMARMVKLLRTMPELLILIKGMFTAGRSVIITFVLLIAITYVFAITFVQLTQGTTLQEKMFSSVSHAMMTLFLRAAMPDLVETVEEDMGAANAFYAFIFLMFIMISSITLMNLMVGVLVEIVNLTALYEREQLDVQFVKTYFVSLAARMDANEDQMISKTEFNNLMHMSEALRALKAVGIDIMGLIDLADYMFRGRDEMPLQEFMDLVLQLRGSNKATVKDIVDTRKFLVQSMALLEQRLTALLNSLSNTGPNNEDTFGTVRMRPSVPRALLRSHAGLV